MTPQKVIESLRRRKKLILLIEQTIESIKTERLKDSIQRAKGLPKRKKFIN